jgi:hypothetical protein
MNASAGNYFFVRQEQLMQYGRWTYSNPGLAELIFTDGNG